MSTSARKIRFGTNASAKQSLRASSGLVAAVGSTLGTLDSVCEIRVLHRGDHRSKFFVVFESATVANVQTVVQAMVQLEEAFPNEHFDYDTIGVESLTLVPSDAAAIALA